MADELPYQPSSDFLRMVIADEVPFDGPFGEANLRRLIAIMGDDDRTNRDWAAMLLASMEADSAEIRAALLKAADDHDVDVRGEAIEGLALRDNSLALPLVLRELSRNRCGYGVFVAASLIADSSLIELLEYFDHEEADPIVREAIEACRTGTPVACSMPLAGRQSTSG